MSKRTELAAEQDSRVDRLVGRTHRGLAIRFTVGLPGLGTVGLDDLVRDDRARDAGDLSRSMQWLSTSHVGRYHRHYKTSGHVWPGRFKSSQIQSDNHLLTVLRYVERNLVRAPTIPVRKAQNWPWSSAGTPPKPFKRVNCTVDPSSDGMTGSIG